MGDGVVISAETNGVETNYTYGLERISAQTGKTRTEYVYDGRGSVAAEVSYNNSWYTLGGVLSKKDVVSKSYTPFGEQIGEQVSGFGYNGEYYNAATGQIYLRARFYEPAMNRFSQKDILRGSITSPGSLNRYSYVQNDPVNFIDPSGQSLKSAWNSVKSWATNLFTGGSSKPAPVAPSKPPAASPSAVRTGAKPAGTAAAAAVRGGTTGTVARGSTGGSAYTGSSSGAGRAQSPGPVQSTAPATRYINANNVTQSMAQAVADARKAADYMNAAAPGSPAAQQATRTYLETKRLAARANATHDPNIARQAVQASQTSVSHANNVATGRSPNTYSSYDSYGNPYSYYNGNRQEGKGPSPDAPRVEDVVAHEAEYCNTSKEVEGKTLVVVTDEQTLLEYNIYMGAAVVMDLAQTIGAYAAALATATAAPLTAGASVVVSYALLEGASLGAVQLCNDIATIIKANADYRDGRSFRLKITDNAIEFVIFGIFSTEDIS